MSIVGAVVGFVLLLLAFGNKRRGFAVRLAAGLSWFVLTLGLLVHSFFASADWAWSAWNGLLIGGALGVALSVFEWLARGAGAASSLARGDKGATLAARWPWLAAGVVALVAGVGGWWFVGAESVPDEPAALVADAAGPSCLCSEGAQCTGPRGGVYCLTSEGKKKYASQR